MLSSSGLSECAGASRMWLAESRVLYTRRGSEEWLTSQWGATKVNTAHPSVDTLSVTRRCTTSRPDCSPLDGWRLIRSSCSHGPCGRSNVACPRSRAVS